jgi:hypothetical protein
MTKKNMQTLYGDNVLFRLQLFTSNLVGIAQ